MSGGFWRVLFGARKPKEDVEEDNLLEEGPSKRRLCFTKYKGILLEEVHSE
jgi:hypothetical protein